MDKNELLKLDGTVVTLEVLEEVDEMFEVVSNEDLGVSGTKYGHNWHLVTLTDGTEINLYR